MYLKFKLDKLPNQYMLVVKMLIGRTTARTPQAWVPRARRNLAPTLGPGWCTGQSVCLKKPAGRDFVFAFPSLRFAA